MALENSKQVTGSTWSVKEPTKIVFRKQSENSARSGSEQSQHMFNRLVQRRASQETYRTKTRNTVQAQFNTSSEQIKLPDFGPRQQNDRGNNHKRGSVQVTNSHIPIKAMGYLQLVDEPALKQVVDKFGGHEFQTQFRSPLNKKTLFLSQIRQVSRKHDTKFVSNYMNKRNSLPISNDI